MNSTTKKMKFIATIPHSGERVPEFCDWLKNLPEPTLMCDVDRYVDQLYETVLRKNGVDFIKTDWHRYAADLNRVPEDVDQDSVVGAPLPSGKHPRGFHWVHTTTGLRLMPKPMSQAFHKNLVELVYEPFHRDVQNLYRQARSAGQSVFHLDLHSMPSRGTKEHRDPGQYRADIVVSDVNGKSASAPWVDLVMCAYLRAGFKVAYNWPYYGGRVSEVYGRPQDGEQCIQVELNRDLYMDEVSKKIIPAKADATRKRLEQAIDHIARVVASSPEGTHSPI